MDLIFYFIYGIWILSEIVINILYKSTSKDKKGLDRKTIRYIWIAISISCTIAVLIATNFYLPIAKYNSIHLIGLTVIIIGCVLRILTIKSLGREFTSDVTIRQNHQLKTDGIYHYLRHPSYSFSLLSFIGFGISLNNWVSLVLVTMTMLYVFNRRITVEETALINQFGQDYIDYMKKTNRLIPSLY